MDFVITAGEGIDFTVEVRCAVCLAWIVSDCAVEQVAGVHFKIVPPPGGWPKCRCEHGDQGFVRINVRRKAG